MQNKVISGIGWSTASSLFRNVSYFVQLVILTRFLSQEQMGIIAVAQLFIQFSLIFLDSGLSVGIIHKKNVSNQEYSSLFWLNIFAGIVLTSLLFFLSQILTKQYNSLELTNILKWLSFLIIINAFGVQQRTYCQKNFFFKRMALIEMISSLGVVVLTLIFATMGYGIYSMVYSSLIGALINNFLHFFIGLHKDSRLSFHFDFKETYPFLKTGVYVVGSSILDFFSRELDTIIVSALLGLNFLGIYNVAKRIPVALFSFISSIITRVFSSAFARINDDLTLLKNSFVLTSKAMSWISFPLYFIIASIAPTLIYYLFGPDYIDGAYVMLVFCVMYAFNGVNGICSSLQIATARTDLGFKWTIYRVLSTGIIYYLSSLGGINIFLLAILFTVFLNAVMMWVLQARPILHIPIKEYIDIYKISFLISSVILIPSVIFYYKPSVTFSMCYSIFFFCAFCYLLCKSSEKKYILNLLSHASHNKLMTKMALLIEKI